MDNYSCIISDKRQVMSLMIFFSSLKETALLLFSSQTLLKEKFFSFQLTGTVGDDPNIIFKSHHILQQQNFERNLLQKQLNTWPRKLLAAASYATKNSD